MRRAFPLLLIGCMLLAAPQARAFGPGRPRTAYWVDPCWPAGPGYRAPVPAAPLGTRLPSPYARDYALPSPAPPSAQPIQPTPGPKVIESRSTGNDAPAKPEPGAVRDYEAFYLAPEVVPAVGKAGEDSWPVSFWNLSGRSVSLHVVAQVGKRTYTLERGRQLTLDLPRQFQWQVEKRDPVSMEVPNGRAGMEIVIRR